MSVFLIYIISLFCILDLISRQVSTVGYKGEPVCIVPACLGAPYISCQKLVLDHRYRHNINVTEDTNINKIPFIFDKLIIPKPVDTTYKCPSPPEQPQNIIVDVDNNSQSVYDCPTDIAFDIDKVLPKFQNLTITEININDNTNSNAKIASSVLKIRRKKLNRHFYKKMRSRLKFRISQFKLKKRRKKEKALHAIVKSILNKGYTFDAEKYMNERLEKARSAGYRVNLFENRGGRGKPT